MDLGLPSGLKWAKWNLGANVVGAPGLFYSWGNTEGHPKGGTYNFNDNAYSSTPGSLIQTNLDLNDDAAHVLWGDPWRMPSTEDFQELLDNCDYEWTALNGFNGYLFTSKINGEQLFFAANGYCNSTKLLNENVEGHYWTKNVYNTGNSYNFYFTSSELNPAKTNIRKFGFVIRPVQGGNPNRSVIPPTPEDEPKEEVTPTVEEPKDKDER